MTMRLQRLGHATLLVETGSRRLLIDPGVYSSEWHQLTDLDAVIITHEHPDHCDVENVVALAQLNRGAQILSPRSVSAALDFEGVEAFAVEPGEDIVLGEVGIGFGGGVHAVVHPDIPQVANVGVVVRSPEGVRLFHPGDAYNWAPPSIDFLALPLSGPWSSAESTGDFIRAVNPGTAFPIHDAGLSKTGVATFMRIVGQLTPEDTDLRSLGPTEALDA